MRGHRLREARLGLLVLLAKLANGLEVMLGGYRLPGFARLLVRLLVELLVFLLVATEAIRVEAPLVFSVVEELLVRGLEGLLVLLH